MFPPLLATSWIDVGIPLVVGLLMLVCPQWAFKKTGSEETDRARESLARKGGALLLVAAAIYFVTTSRV